MRSANTPPFGIVLHLRLLLTSEVPVKKIGRKNDVFILQCSKKVIRTNYMNIEFQKRVYCMFNVSRDLFPHATFFQLDLHSEMTGNLSPVF